MKRIFLLLTLYPALLNASVDLVKVVKSENRMMLMEGGQVVTEYDVAFGANPKGHKFQDGDERTPEGRYTLDYKKEDSSFYRSMHISYPNAEDVAKADELGVSPGGFIMLHGQKNGLGWLSFLFQKFNWTNGCIALTNSDMDDFMERVDVGTPIEIQW
ncbi:L,D-transpeptidase family protein [Oceanobacter mangrovi]|uniref:L,D-transpeptidase family protein n=1 Tax=Oceanobacter mangrovi TaxID=2862510 RepID=UPI001C8EB592|nr:L,D-transpeptidase family protein [Oceanobacter mangrovi]